MSQSRYRFEYQLAVRGVSLQRICRSAVIYYYCWLSSFDCAASEVDKLSVDVEELVVGIVGKVVGPSPSLDKILIDSDGVMW